MKKGFFKSVFICVCSILIVTPSYSATQNTVFQVSTLSSLMQGVYTGDYNYAQLMKQGDFGLGTFSELDGEMVALDGKFYQIKANGKLSPVMPTQVVPFAEVTYFKPTIHKKINGITNYRNLESILSALPDKNIPYAIRIDGTFQALSFRSFQKPEKPLRSLFEISAEQEIFDLHNVKGSLVGFWFPKYWGGTTVPGFHFHFISADRTIGGHILELKAKDVELNIEPLYHVRVYLPNSKTVAQADLLPSNLNALMHKAEIGIL